MKRKNDSVPDVGKEEIPDTQEESEDEESEEDEEEVVVKKKGKIRKISDDSKNIRIEKIDARLDSVNELLKSYSERFGRLSEQIGEVRTMAISNEKEIAKAVQAGEQAVDIVKEVKPEKLRLDYQKNEMKISSVEEKLEANKQYLDTIMEELKELKKREKVFLGTEALLKLNDDVKKDLIDVQRVNSKTRMNADKAESIFIELKNGFSEYEKIKTLVSNIDSSYLGLKKEVESLKISHSNFVKREDLSNFEKTIHEKIKFLENEYSKIDLMQKELEEFDQLIESSLSISKKNQDDIANVALTLGDDNVERVSDFEDQVSEMLGIIDSLAGEINLLKDKVGMKRKRLEVSLKRRKKKMSAKNLNIKIKKRKGKKR